MAVARNTLLTSLVFPETVRDFKNDKEQFLNFFEDLYQKNQEKPWWVMLAYKIQGLTNQIYNRIFRRNIVEIINKNQKK